MALQQYCLNFPKLLVANFDRLTENPANLLILPVYITTLYVSRHPPDIFFKKQRACLSWTRPLSSPRVTVTVLVLLRLKFLL